MRKTLLTSAATLGLALAAPGFAQTTDTGARPGHQPGVGMSQPSSTRASNINQSNAHSKVAPRLPHSGLGANASPEEYARAALTALRNNQTGKAQEALEQAETRTLTTHQAEEGRIPMMDMLEQARQAIGRNQIADARRMLEQGLAEGGNSASRASMPSR